MLSKETLDSQKENKYLLFLSSKFYSLYYRYISHEKKGLSHEMNKYVNVSFWNDNVLMYHTVLRLVMPEANSFFLSDWQTSLNYSVISWCMYIHQSTSLNGLNNSISYWSTMIQVGWLYVYLIVYDHGE